ncbi:phosphatidylserine decarboxylase [Aspergillus stella-maris]|uniref:phosphatidylserine decarboxylase n=1 Tax=Aspergillus stella-maris TaxID=1810926 RepID=UPI003CCDD2E2
MTVTYSNTPYAPIIQVLDAWIIADATRRSDFEAAIRTATSHNIPELQNIHCLNDYLNFIDVNLHWIPTEAVRPKELLSRLLATWFVLDQPLVIQYQSPLHDLSDDGKEQQPSRISWLSAWMMRYSDAIGKFMDTPASASAISTFKSSPSYHLEEYLEPRGGWKTFNEFFARHVKPGRRPVASIGDDSIITSPADFRFVEMHSISAESTVETKGMTWRIAQMLQSSPYKDRFEGGVWLHGFLDVDDYHRVHTPVAGRVVEARVLQGNNYMKVAATVKNENKDKNTLTVVNDTGYHFSQTRGLLILETVAGLLAVLPVGMATVSSVILTAEVGTQLHKGEEIGYFQFGGSDVVLIFESRMSVEMTMTQGKHYKMGTEVGRLHSAGY